MRNLLVAFGLGALFLGWNAPNHYPPWTAFHLELFAALGAALLCLPALAAGALGPARPLPLPRAGWAWLLVAAWPLGQYLAGTVVFRGDALLGLLYGLGVVVALYGGRLWAAQQGRAAVLRLLFTTLVAGGLAAAGLALVQWLRLGTLGWWAMELIEERPYANFAQPNHLGLLMVMAIVAVTALFESGDVKHRPVLHAALGFFGLGIVMCQSRAAALALAAIGLLWMLTRRRVPSRLRWPDLAIATGIGLLCVWAAEPLQHLLMLKSVARPGPVEVGSREDIWLHFWAAIRQHPWFGYGFNQAVAAMAEVADRVQPSRNVIYAHNLVLDLMTWFGIPAALVMTSALLAWLAGWLRRTDHAQDMTSRHAVLAIWLSLLVQSLLEYPYAHAYFLLPAALLAGVVSEPPPSPAGIAWRASRGMAALALATVSLLALTAWEYFRVEDDFRFNRFTHASFSSQPVHTPLEHAWVLDQLVALNASAHIVIRKDMPTAQIEQLHVLARRFHILGTRLDYAKALALNGRRAEAEHELLIVRSVLHRNEFAGVAQHWARWLQAQGLPAS